jgi:hypothetical protein
MTAERWRRVEELYHAALTRDEQARAAFLAEACAGDGTLRQEVESLLAQRASAAGFLDGPAVEMAAPLVSDVGASVLTGRRLGAYQVKSRFGVGGMGECIEHVMPHSVETSRSKSSRVRSAKIPSA